MTKAAFSMLAATTVFLGAVSMFPDCSGLYTSLGAVALWSVTAVLSLIAVVRGRLWRRPAVFLLHIALLVILAGALVTHVWGEEGRVRLRVAEPLMVGDCMLSLESFDVEYYPGTSAPADFVAMVSVDGGEPVRVSMNHTADAGGYRLFLSGYDPDSMGCTFAFTRDRAGTAVSYTGYALLLLAMLAVTFSHRRRRVAVAALVLLGTARAAAAPVTVPRDVADALGDLYVYHNDRVAPLSTLARDFTIRIYGSDSYHGFSPEQVLAGWLFYYDSWKKDPGIKIRDRESARLMGISGDRARLTDFFNSRGYVFNDLSHAGANESFGLVSSAATGAVWRLFPYRTDSLDIASPVVWFSPVDELPDDIDTGSWRMARHSMGYLAELVAMENWPAAIDAIHKIGRYQTLVCGDMLPDHGRVLAERVFLRMSYSVWPMVILLCCGVLLTLRRHTGLSVALCVVALVWVGGLICINAYATRHLPMGNGYETMQWLALFALAAVLLLGRRHPGIIPLGAVVASLALAVAMMGQRSPQLTNLMPVLRSPLLCVHVLTVMLAYALLAIMALVSLVWLCGQRGLLSLARRMLRPAVFLLAAGIFIGAVWANMSWGRYWGWDPKEVWALVTMIVYSFPLHGASLRMFRRDRVFAVWTLAAFATVLMTYVGVNFFLGGLHSYA